MLHLYQSIPVAMKTYYALILGVFAFDGALLTSLAWAYHAPRFEPHRISMKLSMKTPGLKRLLNIAYIAVLSVLTVFGMTYLLFRYRLNTGAVSVPRAIVEILAILLVYDFAYYWLHRAMHSTRGMRWVHGRHHEVRNPTAMESFYLTPLEMFAGLALLVGVAWILGPVSMYSFVSVFFIHSTLNITVHSGLDSKSIFLAPIDFLTRKHYIHHAGDYDKNYASLTPFWDMLFGTRG
jgi:sterol desaturase/sphingolipid hydroxylase (fatty acid hydroxylase superfamily)